MILTPLAISLLSALAFASPAPQPGMSMNSNPLSRRANSVQAPLCNGCGIANTQSTNKKMLALIDTGKTYNVPWDSTMEGWSKDLAETSGTAAAACALQDKDGNAVKTAGTISGTALHAGLQALIDIETGDKDSTSCFSWDGTYQFDLGEGASCAGAGGPKTPST